MDNSEQFLIITVLNKDKNKNENDKCEIHLNKIESIDKIKEDCKEKLGFGNININKFMFYWWRQRYKYYKWIWWFNRKFKYK